MFATRYGWRMSMTEAFRRGWSTNLVEAEAIDTLVAAPSSWLPKQYQDSQRPSVVRRVILWKYERDLKTSLRKLAPLIAMGLVTADEVPQLTEAGQAMRDYLKELRGGSLQLRRAYARDAMLAGFYVAEPKGLRFSEKPNLSSSAQPWLKFCGSRFKFTEEVVPAYRYLRETQLIRVEDTRVFSDTDINAAPLANITVRGVRCIEKYGGSVTEYQKAEGNQPPSHAIYNGPVIGAGATFGDGANLGTSSSSTIIKSESTEAHVNVATLTQSVQQLRHLIPGLGLSQAEEQAAHDYVQAIEREASGDKPDRARIALAWRKLKAIAEKASGPLATFAAQVIADMAKTHGLELPPGT